MKWILRGLFLYVPVLTLVLLLVTTGVAWQQGMLNRKVVADLAELVRSQGLMTAVIIIRMEVFGSGDLATNPSWGRQQVAGRGHAPWVMRSNLDGHPRVLNLALAPDLWAAYKTEEASLYRVWRGDVVWQGAHYDYRHGPQPESRGQAVLDFAEPQKWFLSGSDGQPQPAKVRYLGHRFPTAELDIVKLHYRLMAGDLWADILEVPELDGESGLYRQFSVLAASADTDVLLDHGQGAEALGKALSLPFGLGEEISHAIFERSIIAEDSQLARGQIAIENSDCLACHAEQHQVSGPAWARIAGRYRGYVQEDSLDALAGSIINGASGKWGQLQMPAHPEFTREQARDAAAYILTRAEAAIDVEVPVDPQGQPYTATREYDVAPKLTAVHPAFTLENLLFPGFEPKVGGMDFRADGKLLVASWDSDGGVFLVDLERSGDERFQRIAEGLHEPLGLAVVDDRLFVLQKQELTELIDHDGDDVIDEYRAFSTGWPVTANFHSFAFGLAHRDNHLYALLSVCVLPGGASCPDQQATQGKLLAIDLADGSWDIHASGFRTPNGIGLGPGDQLFVTDNQGDWLPANKMVHIRPGGFYGSRVVPDEGVLEAEEMPPVVWLAQDEIGNSPAQPLLMEEGPYFGQLMYGDVTHGGIKRVYVEEVNGQLQGAVFRFSAGLHGGVNRMVRGPDGAVYLGEVGSRPNWSEIGKAWFGLERLSYTGPDAFEPLHMRAEPDGFTVTFTEALDTDALPALDDILVRQWFYHPTEQYGGPKYGQQDLPVGGLSLSPDRRSLRLRIGGLKPGYVVYLRLPEDLQSAQGQQAWTREAWYTLNAIPEQESIQRSSFSERPTGDEWIELFDGKSLDGWRNYGSKELEGWVVEEGSLAYKPGSIPMWPMIKGAAFGGGSGDLIYGRERFRNFELNLEWKIAEGGNSGIFYLVTDEAHNMPWETGPEMQVLDNDGHADGQIETHRAGDLYDLIAASPETIKEPGQWNEVRIRIQDNHIEHWLNGEKVVSVKRGGPEWTALVAASKFNAMPDFGLSDEGYIVLQDHGDPVWYRNVRLRRLPAGESGVDNQIGLKGDQSEKYNGN